MRRFWPRLSIAARVIAAIAGGYGVALLATLLIARALPGARAMGLSAGMMAFFAVWTAAMIWAFAARGLMRLLLGLAVPALLCGMAIWLLGA